MQALPKSRPDNDSHQLGKLVTGLAVGLAVGATVALLFAPAPGVRTRRKLGRTIKQAGWRSRDAWDDLRLELRRAASHLKRARRRVTTEAVERVPDVD